MLAESSMLTTIDNPYDPFDQFDEWYQYDLAKGYDTCGYLARLSNTSPELSELDQDQALENAIDEIVKENVSGVYKKVTKVFETS